MLDHDEAISFGSEVDRAYFGGAVEPVVLKDQVSEISVESHSFLDAVVWNPGPDHGIGDLPSDGWKDFICIESAQIDPDIELKPDQVWSGRQKLVCK